MTYTVYEITQDGSFFKVEGSMSKDDAMQLADSLKKDSMNWRSDYTIEQEEAEK